MKLKLGNKLGKAFMRRTGTQTRLYWGMRQQVGVWFDIQWALPLQRFIERPEPWPYF